MVATPEDRTSGNLPEDEPSQGFRAEPESSASGGHMSSIGRPSGSFFDTTGAVLPSDIERERHRAMAAQRDDTPVPTPEIFPPVTRSRQNVPTQQMRRRPRGKRRVRRTIRSLDPWSVLKISVLFYLALLVVWMIFVAILYNVLEGLGLFEAIENINEGLVLEAEFDVTLGMVMRWAALLGFVFAIVGSLVNTLIALLYNGIARLVGGLEVTFIEREG